LRVRRHTIHQKYCARQLRRTIPQYILARSGTTWLAKLLDSHPETLYRHEPDSLPIFPNVPAIACQEDTAIYGDSLSSFVRSLSDLNRIGQGGTLPVFRKHGEGAISYQGPRAVTLLTRFASNRLGNIRIPNAFQLQVQDEHKLLWKSVKSVGRLGCIINAVEPIQVVLLIRHPCGVIASRRRGVEQRVMAPVLPDEFKELVRSPSKVARQIRGKTQLQETFELEAFRWAVLNSLAIDAVSHRSDCIIGRYEDLCADTETVLRNILSRLHLTWNEQVGYFLQQSTSKTSTRFYGLHREEPNIDQWRQTIPRVMKDRVQEIISDTPAGQLYVEA
jgi:hypothetical protein